MADDAIEAAIRNGAIAALRRRTAARRAEAKTCDRPEARIANRIADALEEIAADLETEARHGNR
jgi:hypothetical protein